MIPDMTISGTSRMLPNEAVLRWPRLGLEQAAKTHIHSIHANNHKSNTENNKLQKRNSFQIVMLITLRAERHAELSDFSSMLRKGEIKEQTTTNTRCFTHWL